MGCKTVSQPQPKTTPDMQTTIIHLTLTQKLLNCVVAAVHDTASQDPALVLPFMRRTLRARLHIYEQERTAAFLDYANAHGIALAYATLPDAWDRWQATLPRTPAPVRAGGPSLPPEPRLAAQPQPELALAAAAGTEAA